MNKLLIALSGALALTLSTASMPVPAMAQSAKPVFNGPFIVNRAILMIQAGTPDEAKQFARTLPNFKLDEAFGAIKLDDGKYMVRGDKNGPITDTSGKLLVEAPDALMSPN
jgi:hypothetical protein